MNKFIIKNTLGFLLLLSIMWAPSVFAHKSPEGCTGSGLGIGLYTEAKKVLIGDVISFSADVFNGTGVGPIVCDVTNIQASIVTPDGVSHPITLIRTVLSNGNVDHYPNVVMYTVRTLDVQSDGTLRATASDTGTVHQNDTDSQGSGHQGVNIEVTVPLVVIPPPIVVLSSTPSPTPTSTPPPTVIVSSVPTPSPTPTPTPSPVSRSGGGSGRPPAPPLIHLTKTPSVLTLPAGGGNVVYTYRVTNPGTVSLRNVSLVDDKCSSISSYSGDTNNDTTLDTSETWIFSCQTNLIQTTTNIATAEGYGNGIRVFASASATVSVPVLIALANPVPGTLPTFPDAGFAPFGENASRDLLILMGAFMILCSPFVMVFKKATVSSR